MAGNSLKGIIFDCNGVIVDDFPIQKQAWCMISQKIRGTDVTDDEMVHKIRGVPTKDTINRMSEGKLSPEEITKLAQEKDAAVEGIINTSPLYSLNLGLGALLDELTQKKIPNTIATSSSKKMFEFLFNKLGLGKWFSIDKIQYSDGTFPGKPAPDCYLLAAKKIGLEAGECLVFEDAISGITSAQAAGVFGIVVVGRDEQLKEFGKLSRVVKAVHNFSEFNLDEFFK